DSRGSGGGGGGGGSFMDALDAADIMLDSDEAVVPDAAFEALVPDDIDAMLLDTVGAILPDYAMDAATPDSAVGGGGADAAVLDTTVNPAAATPSGGGGGGGKKEGREIVILPEAPSSLSTIDVDTLFAPAPPLIRVLGSTESMPSLEDLSWGEGSPPIADGGRLGTESPGRGGGTIPTLARLREGGGVASMRAGDGDGGSW
ncbi:unnamed protein product, partial [Laminaria digitata]